MGFRKVLPPITPRSSRFVIWRLIVAGSDYQDPGIGYLKESASGDLLFERDSKFADKKDRVLRIRLVSEGGVESSFAGPRDYSGRGLSDTEVELFKARDSLFDEELYHEVMLSMIVANG
jgi:Subunit 17 of Mediator complex